MDNFWIWQNNENNSDEYVDFADFFYTDKKGKITVEISVNGDYVLYINGKTVSFGQYRDYANYKVKDAVDVTAYCNRGKNSVKILCWHIGVKCSATADLSAGLWYRITEGQEVLSASNETTLCRIDKGYIGYVCEFITYQLGLNYHYDATKDDEWTTEDLLNGFENAVKVDFVADCVDRPVKKLITLPLLSGKLVGEGEFKYAEKDDRLAVTMSNAETGESVKDCDGRYFIYDLETEDCGYLYLDLSCAENTKIDIAYGERLDNGRVPAAVGCRNFTLDYTAKKGEQTFVGYFRRLGVRYIQLNVHGAADIKTCGIIPVRYPMQKVPFDAGNELRQKIYDTACHTLELCIHESYEDCPWREQCSYNTDSRLQMLFSYYAFKEYDMARATIELMSRGRREDGFMPLCYPAGVDLPIPSFSLSYFEQVYEYLVYSGDKEFVRGKLPFLRELAERFIEKADGGLLADFRGEFWDFYEWKETLDGADKTDRGFESPLNLFFSYALGYYIDTLKYFGEDARRYEQIRENLNVAIYETFYDDERKVFKTFGDDKFNAKASVLVNSLAVLCDVKGSDGDEILKLIKENKDSATTVGTTLSMNLFRFDAILKLSDDKEFVLREIDKIYSKMLNEGATTFWETELGYKDFDNAGSLCHGWSASPVYYYQKLLK